MGIESKRADLQSVLIVRPYTQLNTVGGGETVTGQIARGLKDTGHRVGLLCQTSPASNEQSSKGSQPYDFFIPIGSNPRGYPTPRVMRDFVAGCRREGVTRIVLNDRCGYNLPLIGVAGTCLSGTKIVQLVQFDNSFKYDPRDVLLDGIDTRTLCGVKDANRSCATRLLKALKGKIWYKWEKQALGTDEVKKIVVSDFLKKQFEDFGYGQNLHVIAPPTWPDNCEVAPKIGSPPYEVVTLARPSWEKGVTFWLEVASRCQQLALPFIFEWVGPQTNMRYVDLISERLPANAKLLPGVRGKQRCLTYERADLGFSSSSSEASPLVHREFIGHSRPVLARSNFGTLDLNRRIGNWPGGIVSNDYYSGIRETISWLTAYANDSLMRSALSASAKETVDSLRRNDKQLVDQYVDAIVNF